MKNKANISLFEIIKRSLFSIDNIFKSQSMEASNSVFDYPMLHSKGVYLAKFRIYSNYDFLALETYIQKYTKRYEKAKNTDLITEELNVLKTEATELLKYFNTNLIDGYQLVDDFIKNIPKDYKEKSNYLKKFRGIVIVDDYAVSHIVFGDETWSDKYEYNYDVDNRILALFCAKLIEFINRLTNYKEETVAFNSKKKQVNTQYQLNDIPFKISEQHINDLTEIIKDYFSTEDLIELKSILPNLSDTNKKLVFLENGNKLSNIFKQLYDNRLITKCDKKTLIDWIVRCFKFQNRNTHSDFKVKTVEGIISSKINNCKNPLIQIIDGNIERKIL